MRRNIRVNRALESSEEAMINLTPLIDVVFVMLIMFIVVAPILEMDQIELAQGHMNTKELSASINESSPISIHVRKDNSVLFNQEKVNMATLKHLLKEVRKKNPQATPLLFHDKNAFFGTYQEVKNAVEDAGFKDLNIVLSP